VENLLFCYEIDVYPVILFLSLTCPPVKKPGCEFDCTH